MEIYMEVAYKVVDGFPDYRVGDDGSAWSKRPFRKSKNADISWRRIKGSIVSGYLRISMWNGPGRPRVVESIHVLVLTAFVCPRPDGLQACHWDDNPYNNSLPNLRWGTSKENHADMKRNGRKPKGESHRLAKLTEIDVIEIRKLLDHGMSERSIAKKFGVSRNPIRDIKLGKTWRKDG